MGLMPRFAIDPLKGHRWHPYVRARVHLPSLNSLQLHGAGEQNRGRSRAYRYAQGERHKNFSSWNRPRRLGGHDHGALPSSGERPGDLCCRVREAVVLTE